MFTLYENKFMLLDVQYRLRNKATMYRAVVVQWDDNFIEYGEHTYSAVG